MTTVTVFSVDVVDDDKIKFRNILYKNIIWTDPRDNKYFCFRIAILRPNTSFAASSQYWHIGMVWLKILFNFVTDLQCEALVILIEDCEKQLNQFHAKKASALINIHRKTFLSN